MKKFEYCFCWMQVKKDDATGNEVVTVEVFTHDTLILVAKSYPDAFAYLGQNGWELATEYAPKGYVFKRELSNDLV